MKGCRVFAFILLMLFTACATCANLFPLFRKSSSDDGTKLSRYLWYQQSSLKDKTTKELTIRRTYSYDLICTETLSFSTAAAATAVAGAAFGGMATLFNACYINSRFQGTLVITSTFFTFLAMTCCVVAIALEAHMFTTSQCSGTTTEVAAGKKDGYSIVEGFILLAVAAGGMLISLVLNIALCCCAVCCSDEERDLDY